VVTIKDLLEVFIGGLLQKGVYYQTVGLADEEEQIVDTSDRMIRDTLQRISLIYNPQFFFVHFKKHSIKGMKTKWSIRTRLMTDKGLFVSKAWAWDARDALGSALERLEKQIVKRKETEKTRILKNEERRKESK
jgi:ribosome-associated translation inhibitor RaiA